MLTTSPLRMLVPLAATAVMTVALAACGSSGPPSADRSGAGTRHETTTSTAAGHMPATTSPSSSTTATTATTTATVPASADLPFSPFTARGGVAQGLDVTHAVTGHCTNPGVAGSSSYRCIAQPGDVPYDPCFPSPRASGSALLCVPDPAVTDVTRFSAGSLPKASTAVPQRRVWAMRLQNGEVCVLVNAPWHGRGPFACPTPSASDSVADCRTPTRAAQGWSTECQAAESASSRFDTTAVLNVWT